MAKLYFEIGANYEEVTRLSERLRELENQLLRTDAAADSEGLKSLQKEYAQVRADLELLVTQAAKSGEGIERFMESTSKALAQSFAELNSGLSDGAQVTGEQMAEAYQSVSDQIGAVLTLIDEYAKGLNASIDSNSRELRELVALQAETTQEIPELDAKVEALQRQDAEYRRLLVDIDSYRKSIVDEQEVLDSSIESYEELSRKREELLDARTQVEAAGGHMSVELKQEILEVEKAVEQVVGTFLKSGASLEQRMSQLSGVFVRLGRQFLDTRLNASTASGSLNLFQAASHRTAVALVRLGMSAKAAKIALSALSAALPIAAVTLVIGLVTKLIQKRREHKEALEEERREAQEFYDSVAERAGSVTARFLELQMEWSALEGEMQKAAFLEQRKRDLEALGVAVADVADAERLFVSEADSYIEAQIRKAEADIYLQTARDKIVQALAKQQALEAASDTKVVGYAPTGEYDAAGNRKTRVITEKEQIRRELEALQEEIKEGYRKAAQARKAGESLLDGIIAAGPPKPDTAQRQTEDDRKRDMRSRQDRETTEREKALKEFGARLETLSRSIEDGITRTRIDAMEDGNQKIQAQQEFRLRQMLARTESLKKVIDDFQVSSAEDEEALQSMKRSYDQLVVRIREYSRALDDADAAERRERKAREEASALRAELENLERSSTASYARIFGNIDSMTKDMLDDVITLAEEEIRRLSSLGGVAADQISALRERIEEARRARFSLTYGGWGGGTLKEFLTKVDDRNAVRERRESLIRQRDDVKTDLLAALRSGNMADWSAFEKLTEEIREADAEEEKLGDDLEKLSFIAGGTLVSSIGRLGTSLREVGSAYGDSGLEGLGETLESIGTDIGNVVKGFSSGGVLGAALAFLKNFSDRVVEAFTTAARNAARAREAAREYAFEMQLLEAQVKHTDYRNAFGADSYALMATQWEKAEKALAAYNEQQEKAFDMLLTYISPSGLRSRELDEYNMALLRTQGILDEAGTVDWDKVEALYSAGDINDSDLARLKELRDVYEDLIDAVEEYVSSLSGDVVRTVSDQMIDNFVATGSAIVDMSSNLDVFKRNLASSIVQSMLLEQVFTDRAQKDIAKLLAGGDTQGAIEAYNELLTQAGAMTGEIEEFLAGLNIQGLNQQSATAGGFQTMSQDTASELNGRFTALQISGEDIRDGVNMIVVDFETLLARYGSQVVAVEDIRDLQAQSLLELQGINENTLALVRPVREMSETISEIRRKVDKL